MASTSFFSRSSKSRDSSPLLPQYRDSLTLQDLSPRASPSPPPSFYRDQDPSRASTEHVYSHPQEHRARTCRSSSTGLGARPPRRIQFAAPPPPIASTILPSHQSSTSPQSSSFASQTYSTNGGHDGASVARRSLSPRLRRHNGAPVSKPLLLLERRARTIQTDLQALLDAQSAGLVKGFGGGGRDTDTHSEAGSSTPTTRSVRDRERNSDGGITPVRQPKKKVIGLRGARRGLLRAMSELAGIRREEAQILNDDIERKQDVLGRLAGWEERMEAARTQLRASVNEVAPEEEEQEISDLRNEERAVDQEIRDMEDRLAQMKARKRWLGESIRVFVNKKEARLSSYRGALREVEGEVKEFLRRPPIDDSVVSGAEESFTSLPPNRRTLGMAKEWWTKEITSLEERKEATVNEQDALDHGAEMWKTSMDLVTVFENDLGRQMTQSVNAGGEDMLQEQIEKMDVVIGILEHSLAEAEGKGWNLMVCAVGAELEAFKEGRAILRGVLGDISASGPEHDVHDGEHQAQPGGEAKDSSPAIPESSNLQRDSSALTGKEDWRDAKEEQSGVINGSSSEFINGSSHGRKGGSASTNDPSVVDGKVDSIEPESEDDGPSADLLLEAEESFHPEF